MEIALLIIVAILLGFILLSMAVLYQVVKQQGRLLLRLDELERRLVRANQETIPLKAKQNGTPAQPRGLPVGTTFPAFHLPNLQGERIALEAFRGKQVLLVHWNPGCGFCSRIAPDLARLQASFHKNNVQLVLVSHGEVEANRQLAEKHGLECPILLLSKEQTLAAFERLGTPVAYLLDEQGQIARPLAVGANEVPTLASEAVAGPSKRKRLPGERPLGEGRLEREGLKPGTPAPSFQLPDIYGQTVSLEAYRGKQVLLVFSDPHCGPCDRLAPQLIQLHQQHRNNGLALVMIGRGDPAENRRKAEAHGIEFPVAVQRKWELSKEYGIFSTPVGFLIGEDGQIAGKVAKGVDEITTLIREGLVSGKEKRNERVI